MFENVSVNTLFLFGIAGFNAMAAYYAFRAKTIATETKILAERTQEDVRKVELATNSMKDQLVAATAKASFGEGKAEGRNIEIERQGGVGPTGVGGGIQEIIPGAGVNVDDTDPKKPEVSVKPESLRIAVTKAVDTAMEVKAEADAIIVEEAKAKE